MIRSIKREMIFPAGSTAPACHAGTVLPLPDGSVLAAWFGGQQEGDDSVEIYCAKRSPAGVWSAPAIVSENDRVAHWNPVLHLRHDGGVTLYYKYGKDVPHWETHVVESRDGGATWSAPAVLVPGDSTGGRGPVKNKCLQTSTGLLLAPASSEQHNRWRVFFDISRDDGKTFERTPFLPTPTFRGRPVRLIQPTLWESEPGRIHAFLRSNQGALYRSDSLNGGLDWCAPYRTALPNNNSGIDCVKDAAGRLWMLYNPVRKNWGDRWPLSLSVSLDNGAHFTEIFRPEAQEGEFSYPAITCRDNRLYAVYTYERRQMVYLEIETE